MGARNNSAGYTAHRTVRIEHSFFELPQVSQESDQMNITLSADSQVIEAARKWATEHGTSINAVVREYLAALAHDRENEQAAEAFAANAQGCAGDSSGKGSFSRGELYVGSRFGA